MNNKKYKTLIYSLLLPLLFITFTVNVLAKTDLFKKNYNPSTPFVEDNAGILSKDDYKYIEKVNEDISKSEKSPQLLVVTVDSLEGHDIVDVAVSKGKQYGIGKKDTNSGLVYIISKGDNKDFLATGYGMEEIITDSIANLILDNDTSHGFYKKSDYSSGIRHNVSEISKYLTDEKTSDTYKELDSQNRKSKIIIGVLTTIFIIFIVIGLLFLDACGYGGSSYSSSSGGFSRGGGWSGGGGSFGGGGGGSSW